MQRISIFEIIESYGPIVYGDFEMDAIITINGYGLNWWVRMTEDQWDVIKAQPAPRESLTRSKDLYTNMTWVMAKELAKTWFEAEIKTMRAALDKEDK